jgi:hypothetical protein
LYVSANIYDKSKSYEQAYQANKKSYYYSHVSSSHNFIKLVDTISMDWKKELQDIRNEILKKSISTPNYNNYKVEYELCRHSVLSTMTPIDEELILDSNYQAIAAKSIPKPSKTKSV